MQSSDMKREQQRQQWEAEEGEALADEWQKDATRDAKVEVLPQTLHLCYRQAHDSASEITAQNTEISFTMNAKYASTHMEYSAAIQ